MAQPTISRMRDCIRSASYVLTGHAVKGLRDDNLTKFDVESIILSGQLVERQRDRQTRQCKYAVQGRTLDGKDAEVVVKFEFGTGRLYVITAYFE
jgi:Zn/Cd-binding protein ZinT